MNNQSIDLQNKSLKKNQKSEFVKDMSFETALKNLESEASVLSGVLDNTSDTVVALEKKLHELKTNFTFKKMIQKEEQSLPKEPEDYHRQKALLEITGYYTQIWWFLSWEPDDVSKRYRLFLISEQKEIVWSQRQRKYVEFSSSAMLRKPLIETKLELRLHFAREIIPFMNSFEKELKNYRLSIASGECPFVNNSVQE